MMVEIVTCTLFVSAFAALFYWSNVDNGMKEREKWCEHKYEMKADYDRCLDNPDWEKK